MVHKSDLVVIGICVGLALGVLIATLVFFGLRWYKKRARLPLYSSEQSVATHPIRVNGLGTSIDYSASLSSSIAVNESKHPQKNSSVSWWSNKSKDQFAPVSGMPIYAYKESNLP